MKFLRLKYTSAAIEAEYKKIKEANMKSFFKLLIYVIIVATVMSIIYGAKSNSTPTIVRSSVFLALSLVLWKYGHKIERFMDYLLAVMCLVLFLSGVITLAQVLSKMKGLDAVYMINIFHSGFVSGLFERMVTLELTRFELKLIFSITSLVVRMVFIEPQTAFTYINIIFFWLLCLFVDFRKEKNDRTLFKSFYDFREELIKFKNLMVSGLPTNILILSKDIASKLFLNEYFQNTFKINPSNWVPKEWLNLLYIEKDSMSGIQVNSLPEETRSSLQMDEFLNIINTKNLLMDQRQSFSFNAKFKIEGNSEANIFETKIFSLIWDGQDAIAIVMNDVTQQYMNLSLKIADTNKDKMIAMVSHELRNPLNGIMGMIHIMEKKIKDEEILRYLSVCSSSGKLLLNLVNSILDLGQIRNNKFKLNVTKGDLTELLQETYLLFEFQFQQKNLYLKIEIVPGTPEYIQTDQNRLRQVLINLIANALKFTFEGGVHVSVSRDEAREGYLRFKVSDTGIGIRDEEKKKLFKMYGRLDQTDRKINIEGVGLGLTISNHLVRLLAGNQDNEGIQVESIYGQGTILSFSVKSNLAVPSGITIENESRSEATDDVNISVCGEGDIGAFRRMSSYLMRSNIRGAKIDRNKSRDLSRGQHHVRSQSSCSYNEKRIFSVNSDDDVENRVASVSVNEDEVPREGSKHLGKVLLVDDNPFNILVAKNFLEGLGYFVQTALNGKLAVDIVIKASKDRDPFDIVFMDCQMPVMDGYEATIILRKSMAMGEIPEIPIVALSANDSDDDVKRSSEAGMCDHLGKPVTEADLKTVLGKYCRKRNS